MRLHSLAIHQGRGPLVAALVRVIHPSLLNIILKEEAQLRAFREHPERFEEGPAQVLRPGDHHEVRDDRAPVGEELTRKVVFFAESRGRSCSSNVAPSRVETL